VRRTPLDVLDALEKQGLFDVAETEPQKKTVPGTEEETGETHVPGQGTSSRASDELRTSFSTQGFFSRASDEDISARREWAWGRNWGQEGKGDWMRDDSKP